MSDTRIDSIVVPGGCFVGDQLMQCSLWEEGCHGMVFKSHRELVGTRHVHSCEEGSQTVGMCTSKAEKFLCTGHGSNCAFPFADHIPHCNVKYNHFPQRDSPFSLYGKCVSKDKEAQMRLDHMADDIVRGGTCVWSKHSCPDETHNFVPATDLVLHGVHESEYDNLCTCDKVKVGACVHKETNYFACAVSKESCDVESEFLPWQRLAVSGNDCRLCETFDKTVDIPTYKHGLGEIEEPTCNAVGAGIGGVVGGIFLTIFTSLLFLHRRYKSVPIEGDGIFVQQTKVEIPRILPGRHSENQVADWQDGTFLPASKKGGDGQNIAVDVDSMERKMMGESVRRNSTKIRNPIPTEEEDIEGLTAVHL